MGKQISIAEALNGKKTFYRKKFQGNGYYPIEKYAYHPDREAFEQFVQKESGWKSWGIPEGPGISNRDWLRYIFERSANVFSYEEMKDNRAHDVS